MTDFIDGSLKHCGFFCSKLSISDNLERSLKKGKGEEQCAAAICSVLVLIQLGASEEREEIFPLYYPILKTILADNAASFATRAVVCITDLVYLFLFV